MSHYRPTIEEIRQAYATNEGVLAKRAWDESAEDAQKRLGKQFDTLIQSIQADAYELALDDMNGEGYLDSAAHEMYATFHNPYRRF
ncbi:hypothetical protein SEA_CASSITA_119 [Microbacterium phage Cassita]|nr:hypothetical protein SEA_CASSITA_119 [Microbacterium phage Cassita]